MTSSILFAAIGTSLALIVWLWHGDPKRRRISGLSPTGNLPGKRRILAFGAAMPGIALAGAGDSAAVMAWLGSCCIGGWLVTQLRFDS